jgi:2-polyprenyl-3-methyl-5-hydroxy-6-metoxy-1,4-benzoquinol methylase
MNPDLREEWDGFARSYQAAVHISTEDVHYGPLGPGESELRLMGDVRGKKVLELGCGGGQNCIALARSGARPTGVDFSVSQLGYARLLARRNGVEIRFVEWDLNDLAGFPEAAWDIILSSFAVEYVEDLPRLFRSVFGLLRPGGILVLCDLHPFAAGADLVGATPATFMSTVHYFPSRPIAFEWATPGSLHVARMHRFHRTLSDLSRALLESRLRIRDIVEPVVERFDDVADQKREFAYRDDSIARQAELWRKLPYTLIVVAERDAS